MFQAQAFYEITQDCQHHDFLSPTSKSLFYKITRSHCHGSQQNSRNNHFRHLNLIQN